ncbi:MAG: 2-oxoacid:acceptor oxidoreductase subunit alpha [Elusimicrobiota bacterium]
MLGDHACAEGAMAAGLNFFGGYPITPSTEIAEHLAVRLPEVGGAFVQMEDEMSSMASIIGASVAGARSMTATSGPGFSLMMENIGLAVMMEAPCVVVDVQRGSPSTGLPTMVGQSDVMQAKWGSHGDYEIVAYSPSSPQECFDLTVKAFNTADRYRVPVFIMADEIVGHMTERVVIPTPDEISIVRCKRPPANTGSNGFKPFATENGGLVPAFPFPGEGHRVHFTSLTHDERGYPAMDADTHDRLVRRLCDKILKNVNHIIELDEYLLDDASVVVVSFGSTARSARHAVNLARNKGVKAGLLRLVTLWPFPDEKLAKLGKSKHVKAFVAAEVNLGQVAREVERATKRPVIKVGNAGGRAIEPEVILEAIAHAR